MNAIDLNSGEYVWKIPLGEYPELAEQGLKDTDTGKLLWETVMANSGNATPITYEVNGKQFVVIAAFGGYGARAGATGPAPPSGGAFVAFALP